MRSMYVCLCKGITDGQIREAVQQGCDSLRDLRRELGVGGQCGKCARDAREVLRDTRAQASVQPYAAVAAAASRSSGPVLFTPQPA